MNMSTRMVLTALAAGFALSVRAATPAAVWDGDFKTATKGGWTLSSAGSTITDAAITVGTTPITMTPSATQKTGWYTVVYKVKGLTYTSQTPLATWGRPKETSGSWNDPDLIGVFLDYDYSWGVWNGAERAQYSMQKKVGLSQAGTEERRIVARFHSGAEYGTWAYVDGTRVFTADKGLQATINDVNRMTILGFQYNNSCVLKGAEVTCIAVFSDASDAGDAAYTSYRFPSESGAYEASVGSGTAAWSDLMWRKGTGAPVSTADLPDGSAIHVTVSLGATLTIAAEDQAQLAAKGIGLKATQFTNNGTVKFSGGTVEEPIAYEADGEANRNIGVWTIAADTYLKVTPNANKLYRVTGSDRATSILEFARTDDGTGATDGTVFRSLTLVANVTAADRQYWIERAGSFDASVDVVAKGPITVYERGQTFGSLSGSGDIVKYEGATYTLTLTPTRDADYSGASSHNFTIAGSAVQTLSGAFTGALAVNGGATVGLDGDRVAPSSISGPGTVRKVGTGTTTIAGAKVSKTTKPAAIEVVEGTLNFSAGQFFDADKENVALPLTVTGGTLNLNGAWTYTGGDGSGWLTQRPITLGGATATKVEGGAVTFYNNTITDAIVYRGNAGANAPAEFASNWHSSYSDQTYSRNILVEKGAGEEYDLLISGTFGLSGGQFAKTTVHKTGPGTVRFTGTYNFPFLAIDAGCWQLGSANALAASTTVAAGATLDLGGQSLTNLSITCAGTIDNGALVSSGVTVDLTGATLGANLTLAADLSNAVAGTRPFAGVDTSRVTTVGENKYLTYNPATGTFTLRDDCKLWDELKWLPIGDSITEGEVDMGHPGQGTEESRGGYRYQLWNEFEQAGQTTRSVGYRTGHQGTVEPDDCRWAWHAAQYGGVIMHDNNGSHGAAGMNVENTLEVAGYPDIVTVLIGVNDLSFVASTPVAYEWVFTTWQNMVVKYADQRPHTKIVVSTLLPAGNERMTYIAPFNAFVRNAARDKKAPFDRPNVVFADIAKIAFNDEAIAKYFKSSDFLHPNEEGAKVVAAAWMSVLQPLVADMAKASAVPVQIHNATSGKVSVRYSKAIKSIESATLTITGTDVNGKAVNCTFTGPTISPTDKRVIEFDAQPLIAGDYTVSLADVVGTDANNLPLPSTYTYTSDLHLNLYGTGAAENIPAAFRKGFERMQTINVTEDNYDGNGPNVPCEKLRKSDPLTHVGYYVELQRANEAPLFVWVSMDAAPFNYATNNVGVPTVTSGVIRSKVTELQVYGNHGNFTNTAIGDKSQTGVIEFSPWKATGDDQSDFPKEFKSGKFGWNDTLTDTSTLWGCMQVARETHAKDPDDYTRPAGEMIFAFNTFNSNNLTDLGIGTFSTHHCNAGCGGTTPVLDWTDFAQTTGYEKFMLSAYKVKKIEIWVKGVMDPTMFCICGPVQHDVLNELMPRPRFVSVGASVPLARAPTPPAGVTGYYELRVKNGVPTITGDAEGQRYAKVTFDQLKALAAGQPIPDCTIVDWPEFKYRGLLLDCGRNYQSIESIYDIIDHLAKYKMNVFHWHLTDNPGWRLESKKYPQLQYDKAFTRQIGKYYTQQQFKDVVAYAKARGITVIPELDMPGHTAAFRRGLAFATLVSEEARNELGDLIQELCNLVPAEDMPIIHLGTDEAREVSEQVPQSHLDYWANIVTSNGRKLMGWSPGLKLPGQTIKQLWMGTTDPRGDTCPYIDSQNSYYINHVDPEELLSVAAYQQPCRWGEKGEKLGAIIGVWHDDRIAETEDVARMNAVYPAVVMLSDNFWRGRETDEPTLYARLPAPSDPRFALAADLERRTIAQRDRVLKDLKHPFPYVAQTQMRWRMTDTDTGAVVATDIPQATTYPQHFWFPASKFVDKTSGNIVLETWITSPRTQRCGAWIDMTGFSRSDGRKRDNPTPALGQWNRHGATLTVNGAAIAPPKWTHPAQTGDPAEVPLVDEGYHYRAPSSIVLKKGVNHIRLTLPKSGGWKWIGTFTPINGTSDHPREVPGLKYDILAEP